MAPAIVTKRGFLALVLWVLKGRNGYRVIIMIETGHSNLMSCFGPRIRALARYFTSAFASVKYPSQRPHAQAKTWHKIWMTGLNPTNNNTLFYVWHYSWTKWPPFRRRYFQMHFHEWKVFYFDSNLLRFVSKAPMDNKSVLVQVMVWRRTGDKSLSEAVPTQFTDAYMRP